MTPAQAEAFRYNVLDPTKTWPQREYPLRQVGRLVLNRNVENYFAEVEQIAFSPSNVVPYFEPSADPVLQARFFVYAETQRYRLGVNFNQLPINKSKNPVANFQRDGFMAIDNQGSRPNYKTGTKPLRYITNDGTIYGRPRDADREARHERWVGSAYLDLIQATEQDFEQPRDLVVNVLTESQRQNLVNNIAGSLRGVKNADIKKRALSYWASVHQELSNRVADNIGHARENPLQGLLPNPPVRFRVRQTCGA